MSERISSGEQLKRWVAGESIHREVDGIEGGECCPDFSCCRPELLAEPEIRRQFAASSDSDRLKFLGAFLGAAIARGKELGLYAQDVVIVTGDPEVPT